MKRKQSLISLILAFTMLGALMLPAYADQISDLQWQQEQVSRDMSQQQNHIQQVKNQEKSMLGKIGELEKNMSNTQAEINILDDKIAHLNSNITKTSEEIEQRAEELDQQTEILGERLVFLYEEGDISYLEVLLEAEDLNDFLTRYEMMNSIVDQDKEMIASISKQRDELERKKSDLDVQKEQLEFALQSQEKEKKVLVGQVADKKGMLSTLKQERKEREKALKELEETSNQLERMIRQIQGGSSAALGTGVYTWPTPGWKGITSPYGMRWHPILNQRKMHTGVDIGAPGGASIVAADSGTVITAGWMGGYGQVVVIDHGKGMSTLYAHQSKILVSKGEVVAKGQTIGKVGSTGWSTGPHLHFEVRINGAHTNPMNYIK